MKRVVLVLVVLAVAGVGVYLWRSRTVAPAATPGVSHGSGSAVVDPSGRTGAAPAQPAHVTITVRDAAGAVARAAVRLAPDDGDVTVVQTDAAGVAAIDLVAGRYEISASADGHDPGAVPARELAAGERVTIAITLAPGGRSLTGTITDATGGPIAGARVDAARIGDRGRPDDAVATTATAADGSYALTVAEGNLLVAVSSPDYAAQSRYVEVGPGGAVADFALVPGGVIEGVVLDERSRAPVPGAVVSALRDRGGAMMLAEAARARAIAGADGRFRLTGLRPGSYELGARAAARTVKAPVVVGLGVAEQVADVELLVSVGPVVSGTVVDEQGTPVAGAEVTAIGRGYGAEARSGADGAFVLHGIGPGSYMVVATATDYLPAGSTALEVQDADVKDVRVRVKRGLQIVGHVEPRQICEVSHDAEGGEMTTGLPILIAPRTTAADGEFQLGPASLGKARLKARCPGGDQGELSIDVTATMAPVILVVTPGGSIAGRVVDGGGKPVAGATVMAAVQGPTSRTMIVNGRVTSGIQAITGERGAFEMVGLSPGSYALSVLDRGRPLRMRGKRVEVKLGPKERKSGVELAVDRPDGKIEGVVTGPDGRPLADSWVSVQQDLSSMIDGMVGRGGGDDGPGAGPPDGEPGSRMMMVVDEDDGGGSGAAFPPALTDASGRFSITGLPHATYQVVAEAQAGALRGRVSGVKPDASITIQALGVTSLSGTVNGPGGPAAVFTVELDGPTTAARTFTGGTFKLGRVDPGAYTVRVSSPDGNAEGTVQVVPNQPATIDLVLASNAVVIGRLADADGKPLAGVGVALVEDRNDGKVSLSLEGPPPTSGPDGSFRVEGKAGTSMLIFMAPPRPFTRRGLALEAGKTLDLGVVKRDAPAPP